ncbi:monosaccharide ABC transporter membrane protein, CUT2 family [Klenkia marina]|uniref:Xylose transport system permease protein XylH n=1 Tax=Klenkia marina TaxID=1960309 RepID=A0A1G4XWI3_9ACTN|nr:ABC transporter permease [Klenkia marina]SCX45525.1 monosaccharide ABC transporter membrane protein, CUT2 family [Klenkia marina]
MPARRVPSRGRRLLTRPSTPAFVGVLVALAVFGAQAPQLLGTGGWASVLDSAALVGIGAVAVTLLLVAGQFDVSIGVLAVASSVAAGLLVTEAGWGIWPALGASLVGALAVGAVNGVLVVLTGLPSFLVTLGTFLVLQGGTLVVTQSVAGRSLVHDVDVAPGWSSAQAVFGSGVMVGDGRFKVSILWWLAAVLLAGWLLRRTRFGNAVYALGGSRRAARELGVPTAGTTVALYLVTATAAWLVGTLVLVRQAGVPVAPEFGAEIEYLVVAVIGGCLLSGGYGSAVGAAAGALLYGTVRTGIGIAGWSPSTFQVVLGVLLLVALLANGVARRRLIAVPRS